MTGVSVLSFAQFKIHSNGKISINTTETPNSPISLNHAGNADYYMSYQGPKRFLYAAANDDTSCGSFILRPTTSSTYSVALSGYSYPFEQTNAHAIGVGVVGRSYGVPHPIGMLGYINPDTMGAGAGIVGSANTQLPSYSLFDHSYAGFFLGDVKSTGNFIASGSLQGMLLGTAAPASGTATLSEATREGDVTTTDLLTRLEAYSYSLGTSKDGSEAKKETIQVDDSTTVTFTTADEENYIGRQSAENTHYALDAEQLEKAFPGLVYEMADGTKTINYVEMVPLLVQGINELNARIRQLESDNARLSRAATTGAGSAPFTQAVLYQNTPNPFSTQTEIRFSLPDDAPSAYIYIFDMQGQMKKQIAVDPSMQSVTISGYELQAGIYLYSLVVGGQEIDTKRMILSK